MMKKTRRDTVNPPTENDDDEFNLNDEPLEDQFDKDTIFIAEQPADTSVSLFRALGKMSDVSSVAKGLVLTIMSHSNFMRDIPINSKTIYEMVPEGRDSIRKALRELESHGFAKYSPPVPGKRGGRWAISSRETFKNLEGGSKNGASNSSEKKPVSAWISGRRESRRTAFQADTETPSGTQKSKLTERSERKNGRPTKEEERKDKRRISEEENEGDSSFKILEQQSSNGEPQPSLSFSNRLNRLASERKQKSLNGWQKFNRDAKALWNQCKRPEWSGINGQGFTGRDRKMLSEFWAYFSKDYDFAIRMFELGVRWAAKKESWAEDKVLSLAQLMVNDKLIDYANKAESVLKRSPSSATISGPVSTSTATAGGAKMGRTGHAWGIPVGSKQGYLGSSEVVVEGYKGEQILVRRVGETSPFLAYADELSPWTN